MDGYLKLIVIVGCTLMMIGGLGGILYDRITNSKGIGVRVIQFLSVVFIIPTIIILAIHNSISSETIATLLGTVIGYILSGVGKDEQNKKGR